MTDVPRSEQFDDVYFSVQDGLAETQHVFLDGNRLPDAWHGQDNFTIAETGFGTGLNFLAIVKLWHDTPDDQRPRNVHFISFEKYPLSRDYINTHLGHWGALSEVLGIFLTKYPSDLSKEKYELDIMSGIKLTLYFDDINDTMPQVNTPVDCWFLDGFKPSSNPDMWNDTVFQNMARLSHKSSTFATFTAAGFVKRGLQNVGFDVRKVKGFGRKREMCVGGFIG